MDKAYWGTMRWNYFRWGVYRDEWDRLLKVFADIASRDLTRRKLVLNPTRDSVTGWYPRSFTEDTVEGILIPRGSSSLAFRAGTYVRTDALLLTADGFQEADEVEDSSRKFWEVKAVRDIPQGGSFSHRECDLTYLPLHELSYSSSAPTVEDARTRTKEYWDTYLDVDNLQNKGFIVVYADPDYPLLRVFKERGIQIIFAVAQPTSTPKMDVVTQAPYGYKERVSTHILTLDTELQWLAEAEMRRIVEAYPKGSNRSLERKINHDRWLGSARLYDTEFPMTYERDTT